MKDNTTLNMSAIDYNNGLVGYEIPEGYEFDTVIDNKVVLKKLKPTYPKTYEECCDIIECCKYTDFKVPIILPYDAKIILLLENIRKLLICRDAYWKIAGEEMGLGKPWEPNWIESSPKYTITFLENRLITHFSLTQNYILVFPTEEMRNAFYENFKDLIESCKELL